MHGWGCFSQMVLEKQWYRDNDTDERNEIARKAFEMVMTLTLRKPASEKYMNFSKRVKEKTFKDYGADIYNYNEEVSGLMVFKPFENNFSQIKKINFSSLFLNILF